MALPVSMDPCENLNATVDRKTGDLEQKGVKVSVSIILPLTGHSLIL